jgi:hypothetical protein
MDIASIQDIKLELENLSLKEVRQLCLRLARFKKENKELLSYVLFESNHPDDFIRQIKDEIDQTFSDLPKSNIYLTKKSLRKLIRTLSKYNRYMSSAEAEIQTSMYLLNALKTSAIPIRKYQVIKNLYDSQLKKIRKAIDTVHEDLQHDYLKEVQLLEAE